MDNLNIHVHDSSKDFERRVIQKLDLILAAEKSEADVLSELLDLAERSPQIVFSIGPVSEQR